MEITFAGAITGIFLLIFAATLFAFFEGTPQFPFAVEAMRLFAIFTVILATARVMWLLGFRSMLGKIWMLVLIGLALVFAGELGRALIGHGGESGLLAALGGVILIAAVSLALKQFEAMASKKAIYTSLLIGILIALVMAFFTWPILQSGLDPLEKSRLFITPFFELAAIMLVINIAVALRGSGFEKACVFIVQGMLSIISADLIIGQLTISRGYTIGTADLLYIAGFLLLAIGVFVYRVAPLEGRRAVVRRG